MADGQRRTQAERRAETHRQVLDSACRLFGERGYSETSLDDVAGECGLTTRPIYHYFGNKRGLFEAVNAEMETRIVQTIRETSTGGSPAEGWRAFLRLCEDPGFRQVVLIDSPNVLGRERWNKGGIAGLVTQQLLEGTGNDKAARYRQEMLARLIIGAFAEVALMVAEADDVELARAEADSLISQVFGDKQ